MAFLRLPTKTESKRSIAPAPQQPKGGFLKLPGEAETRRDASPKAAPRPAAVPARPAIRTAPGPATVAEGPKRRGGGPRAGRGGRRNTALRAAFSGLFAPAPGVRVVANRAGGYGT